MMRFNPNACEVPQGSLLNEHDKVVILSPAAATCTSPEKVFVNAKLVSSSVPGLSSYIEKEGVIDLGSLTEEQYCDQPENPYLQNLVPSCRSPIVGGENTPCSIPYLQSLVGGLTMEQYTYWSVICTKESQGNSNAVGASCLSNTAVDQYVGLFQVGIAGHYPNGRNIFNFGCGFQRCNSCSIANQALYDEAMNYFRDPGNNFRKAVELGWNGVQFGTAQCCHIPGANWLVCGNH